MANPNSKVEFQQRIQPITDDLIRHLRGMVPRDWRIAMLQLDVSFSPLNGTRSTRHRLWNPLTDAEVHDFPEALFHNTSALHAVFTEFHQVWTRCLVQIRPNSRGGNECEINYHYARPA